MLTAIFWLAFIATFLACAFTPLGRWVYARRTVRRRIKIHHRHHWGRW
jgi:predicted PurR-regulated permease PerM